MNKNDEVGHAVSMGYRVKGEQLVEQGRRRSKTPPAGEARPAKTSGFRENKRFDVAGFRALAELENPGSLIGVSGWVRHGIQVISTLVTAAAPDGSGDSIPQWHLSVARTDGPGAGARPSDGEVRQALACFGLVGADEDNHEPGAARHFWQPVDPDRRVACECKEDEDVITEPDGHRWTTPKDGACRGCDYERRMSEECGVYAPCPRHRDDRVDAMAYGLAAAPGDLELDSNGDVKQAKWGPSKLAAIVPIVRELEALKSRIAAAVENPRTELESLDRQLKTICTRHQSLTGRVCELPAGHPGDCVFQQEAFAQAMDAFAKLQMDPPTADDYRADLVTLIDHHIGPPPEVLVEGVVTFTSDEVIAKVRERREELMAAGAAIYDAAVSGDSDKAQRLADELFGIDSLDDAGKP